MVCTTPTPTTVPKPDSVLFGELAIAAGLAGQPVAVCFSESAATVDCELWKYFSRFARPSHVLHVHGQKDITKLRKAVGHWRLIVVHAPRLFNTVAWTVTPRREIGSPELLSFATLCIGHQVSHAAFQPGGQFLDRGDGDVAFAAFDHADERSVQSGESGQTLLRQLPRCVGGRCGATGFDSATQKAHCRIIVVFDPIVAGKGVREMSGKFWPDENRCGLNGRPQRWGCAGRYGPKPVHS